MSLPLTEEQEALKNSVREFLAEQYPPEQLRKIFESRDWDSSEEWGKLEALGMHTYFSGGAELGASFRDLALVAHETGYALAPVPLAEDLLCGAFLFGSLLSKEELESGAATFGAELVEKLKTGTLRVGLARHGVEFDFKSRVGRAKHIACSNAQLLTTIIPPKKGATISSVTVFELEGNGHFKREDALDRLIKWSSVSIPKISKSIDLSGASAGRLMRLDEVLRAAEISGAAERAIEMTKEYVATRKQYGTPIGSFQAVQHRLVDMYVMSQALKALVDFAAWCADRDPQQLPLAALAAISYATKVGPEIIEGAIQLHGGIGFTWEYPLHLYLRRVKTIEALYGGNATRVDEILSLVG